jgi:zinc transport system substrate-binding protein
VLETGSLVTLIEAAAEVNDHVNENEDSHDHGDYLYDPHTWLDPRNMAKFADGIAAQLAEIDPAHASTYRTNADSFGVRMDDLDHEFATGLQTCERTEFMTTHAAFGYLAQRYHLTQLAIAGVSPEDEPSPAHLAELQNEARAHGITTVFTETLASPAYSEMMANDLGLKTGVLDPIEGITDQSNGTDYPSVMESNLAALQAANGCK